MSKELHLTKIELDLIIAGRQLAFKTLTNIKQTHGSYYTLCKLVEETANKEGIIDKVIIGIAKRQMKELKIFMQCYKMEVH